MLSFWKNSIKHFPARVSPRGFNLKFERDNSKKRRERLRAIRPAGDLLEHSLVRIKQLKVNQTPLGAQSTFANQPNAALLPLLSPSEEVISCAPPRREREREGQRQLSLSPSHTPRGTINTYPLLQVKSRRAFFPAGERKLSHCLSFSHSPRVSFREYGMTVSPGAGIRSRREETKKSCLLSFFLSVSLFPTPTKERKVSSRRAPRLSLSPVIQFSLSPRERKLTDGLSLEN